MAEASELETPARSSAPGRGRLRPWLKRLALLSVSLLVCVIMVEVVLRMTLEYKPDLGAYVIDFDLGKRLKPNYVGTHFGAPVEINRWGMRDRDFEKKKPAGTFRVIALGDSWTFGSGVKQSEAWPKRLEAALAGGPKPVEVMNTGVSGYETYHEAFYYEKDLQSFEHDLVVVGVYPVNDVHYKQKRYRRYKRLHSLHPLLYEAYVWPKKHLYIQHVYSTWRKARRRRQRERFYAQSAGKAASVKGGFAPGEDDWTTDYNPTNKGWVAMQAAFRSIGETARKSGVKGVVVLFPDLRDLRRYETYCHPRVAPKIAKVVAEAGLVLIDLKDDFMPYADRVSTIGLREEKAPSHPNAKGDDLIGRWIARELRARGLVPK